MNGLMRISSINELGNGNQYAFQNTSQNGDLSPGNLPVSVKIGNTVYFLSSEQPTSSCMNEGNQGRCYDVRERRVRATPYDGKLSASGRLSASEGRPPASEERPPAPEGRPPAPEGRPPASERRLPASERRLRASERRLPASERRPPASERRLPASERRLPASERRLRALPASERRLPASERRPPASERRPPASERRLPASERRLRALPASERRLPASERRLRASERRQPASERRQPASERRRPAAKKKPAVGHGRDNSRKENECAICLDKYSQNKQKVTLTCKHVFCRTCTENWFKAQALVTCPLCRDPCLGFTTQTGEYVRG